MLDRPLKAVVVIPPVSDFYFTPARASGLGAIAVKHELETLGLDVSLFNIPLLKARGRKIPIPESHNYLQEYLVPGEIGPLSFFTRFKYYGPSLDESLEMIIKENADYIFFSLFAFVYADDMLDFVQSLKEHPLYNGAKLVTGGPGVAVLPEYFSRTHLFHHILTGDAEQEIPELFGIQKELLETPKVIITSHRDRAGNYFLSSILSRGCPLKCKFCSNFLTQGREFRHCSLEDLEKQLKLLEFEKGYSVHLNLEDDNLLIRKSFFLSALRLFKSYIPNLTISIDNGLDYTMMGEVLLKTLVDLGFIRFTFSLGSSNIKLLEEEERPADLKRLERLLDILADLKIPVSTFVICGLPGDDRGSMISSMVYIHMLKTESNLSLFYTVPGLPRFEDRELFLNRSSRLCASSAVYPWSGSLTTLEMITLFRISRLSNLIQSGEKSKSIIELIDRIKRDKQLYSLRGKNKEIIDVPQDKRLVEEFLCKISEN